MKTKLLYILVVHNIYHQATSHPNAHPPRTNTPSPSPPPPVQDTFSCTYSPASHTQKKTLHTDNPIRNREKQIQTHTPHIHTQRQHHRLYMELTRTVQWTGGRAVGGGAEAGRVANGRANPGARLGLVPSCADRPGTHKSFPYFPYSRGLRVY